MVEFQKRGIAHVYLLLFLKTEDKIRDATTLDQVIWAELPSVERYLDLHSLVLSNMIHLCDERCSDNNCRCKPNFPKLASNETIIVEKSLYTKGVKVLV